ncbi:hypothetical protein D3C84_1291030 [compost metagenome]
MEERAQCEVTSLNGNTTLSAVALVFANDHCAISVNHFPFTLDKVSCAVIVDKGSTWILDR